MSDDSVLRNRSESLTCQLSPIFQDSTASNSEYLVQRPREVGRQFLEPRDVLEQRDVEFQRAFVDVVLGIDFRIGVLHPAHGCDAALAGTCAGPCS